MKYTRKELYQKSSKRTEVTEDFCKQFHDAVVVTSRKIKKGKKPKFVRIA